jgi:hypothetical protein
MEEAPLGRQRAVVHDSLADFRSRRIAVFIAGLANSLVDVVVMQAP